MFWMSVAGTLCWIVCFAWMHRISSRQDAMLRQLHGQGKRIVELSKIEHDLLKEVHPQVTEIKEDLEEVIQAAKEPGKTRRGTNLRRRNVPGNTES